MKKIAIMLLAALMLTVFAAMPAFAAAEAPAEEAPSEEAPVDYSTKECYEFCEDAVIGFWLATVTPLGDNEWETYSEENYVSATFTAAKPFSAIKVPHWAGNPASFKGITPVDVEFAIFKAVENNWGSDYNSDDAVVREVKTFDHDDQEFIWEFPQQAAGRYCVRIMQLTEEGGYIVIAQGEPLDDDIEFDYENARLNNSGKEGISLTVYYDEGPGPEVDPGEATAVPPTAAPTEAPTAAPTEAPTEAPTAAPTEALAEPTEQAGEATEKPADDNKGNTEKDKKDNTWLIVGIVAAVVVVAAVACIAAIAAKKKKK